MSRQAMPAPARSPQRSVDDLPVGNSGGSRLSARRLMIGVLLTAAVVLTALVLNDQRGDDRGGSPAGGGTYLVRSGDTIASVADLHGLSVDRLMDANDLTLSDSLEPGSRLVVPDLPTEGRSPPRELLADDRKLTYEPLFDQATARYDLPPGLLEALAWHESEWVNVLVDENGRTGLGQLRPEIVDFLRRDVVGEPLDPRRPEDNISLTAAYLAHLLEAGGGDQAAALAGYYLGLEAPAGGTWDLDVVGFVRDLRQLTPDFVGPVFRSSTGTTSGG
jgi:LysM repeat protein